jgi:hypothetical protein
MMYNRPIRHARVWTPVMKSGADGPILGEATAKWRVS